MFTDEGGMLDALGAEAARHYYYQTVGLVGRIPPLTWIILLAILFAMYLAWLYYWQPILDRLQELEDILAILAASTDKSQAE